MSNRNCPFILSLLIVFISHVLLLNIYSCENRNIRYQIYTYCLLVLLTQVIINMDYKEILFILRVDIYMSINILKFTLFSYNCNYVNINVMYNNTLLYVLWIHAVQKYTVYVFLNFSDESSSYFLSVVLKLSLWQDVWFYINIITVLPVLSSPSCCFIYNIYSTWYITIYKKIEW